MLCRGKARPDPCNGWYSLVSSTLPVTRERRSDWFLPASESVLRREATHSPWIPEGMMSKERGDQKGAQRHAEGQQGPKTTKRQIDQLESGSGGETQRQDAQHPADGRHRLFEQREQHDEAELNSEKNRLNRDIQQHDHVRENFQVQGGAKNVRVESRHAINPEHPDAPQPGPANAPRPERARGEGAS